MICPRTGGFTEIALRCTSFRGRLGTSAFMCTFTVCNNLTFYFEKRHFPLQMSAECVTIKMQKRIHTQAFNAGVASNHKAKVKIKLCWKMVQRRTE